MYKRFRRRNCHGVEADSADPLDGLEKKKKKEKEHGIMLRACCASPKLK